MATYFARLSTAHNRAHPEHVDVGNPDFADRLGPTWYPIENGFRWMPKTATVNIRGPSKAGQVLEITGCPALLVAKGPLQVAFAADGMKIGAATLHKPDQEFVSRCHFRRHWPEGRRWKSKSK